MKNQNCELSTAPSVTYQIRTLEDAQEISALIANQTPNPIENLIISELMYNAIEHGNLGITFEEKAFLLEHNCFLQEVERRLQLPENLHKYAEVTVWYFYDTMQVCISDSGKGFDYEKYLLIDNSKITHGNGRGIALANSMLQIRYNKKGNSVCVMLPYNKQAYDAVNEQNQ
jgi:hypothetical protein